MGERKIGMQSAYYGPNDESQHYTGHSSEHVGCVDGPTGLQAVAPRLRISQASREDPRNS